jgi:hypothetical protein
MKKFAIVVVLAALAGCAAPPPGPAYYGTRAYAQPTDPSQWHVVSVTPVPAGTGARVAASGQSTTTIEPYASTTTVVTPPVYVAQPVYVPPPVYAPAPVYVDPYPYWYAPFSIGLDFSWGHWHGGHGWGGRGWGGRGWGGHARYGWRHH